MASTKGMEKDWYSVLGARPSDSPAQLKQKYQKLALLYHPDKQRGEVAAEQLTEGTQRFIEISQAWNILGNEETKNAYDLQRREIEMTRSIPVDTQIHIEEMLWDDDEESFSLPCRCGGRYILDETDLEQTSLVNCNSCSLIIEILQGER
ncbi:dnaJ homolog subfamily C member 24 isoform X2 [Mixophyes fleayi]